MPKDDRLEVFEGGHGKKNNQKLKPYLVLQHLLRHTDENHVLDAYEIVSYLQDECGIYAERRSIYRDIDEINKAMLVLEYGINVHEAEERLQENEDEKVIIYDKGKKGFYTKQRHYDSDDIRLLAECVYSAKFLSAGQAERLANVVCEFVSEYQEQEIKHDAFLTDRVKTDNKGVLKITFQYLKYSINDVGKQVERRKGMKYTVSPYKLLINDGNYYLLAFDDYAQDMRTYRVDRMKGVALTGDPREGAEAFAAIDLKSYTKRVFSMFGGKQERVTIRFINPLLDAVVDRFGNDKSSVQYAKVDDTHFSVTTQVEISDQFFGWVLGFGKKAKILEPASVVDKFAAYLDKVREMY